MPEIDSRLLEADDEMRITENFNRVLNALDELTERVEALEVAGTQTDETEPAAQTDETEPGEQDGGEGQ